METKVSEIVLSYKRRKVAHSEPLTSSAKVNDLIHSFAGDISLQEKFFALFFDTSMACIGILHLSTGGTDSVTVDCKLLYGTAVTSASKSVILAHNHPSGSLRPSEADKAITNKIKKGLETLDIQLLDHLIITESKRYFSFSDEGLI